MAWYSFVLLVFSFKIMHNLIASWYLYMSRTWKSDKFMMNCCTCSWFSVVHLYLFFDNCKNVMDFKTSHLLGFKNFIWFTTINVRLKQKTKTLYRQSQIVKDQIGLRFLLHFRFRVLLRGTLSKQLFGPFDNFNFILTRLVMLSTFNIECFLFSPLAI